MPLELVLVCITAGLATVLITLGYRLFAKHHGILAYPCERSAHGHSTPMLTGAGVVLLTVVAGALAYLLSDDLVDLRVILVYIGPLMIGVLGLMDDLKALAWQVRFLASLLAGAWCMYWLEFPTITILGWETDLAWFGFVFGTLSLAWIQNLYNFMDGIDGLAIQESVFVCLAALLIGSASEIAQWNAVVLVLGATSLGFAMVNWPSARVFMGDSGSAFIGMSIGVFALAESFVSVWVWMILLGYFISDACLTIAVRLIRGEKIYQSHCQHAYQHLSRRYGDRVVLYGILVVNVAWFLPIAFLAHWFPDLGVILLLMAVLPLLVTQFLCGAGQPAPRLEGLKLTNAEEVN